MVKITFIGAGSTVFAKNLIGDILRFPELADSTIAIMDIDAERLKTSEVVARKITNSCASSAPRFLCSSRTHDHNIKID